MRLLILLPALFLARSAWAHEAVVDHAHPHGDWELAGLGLLALGLVAAAMLPVLRARLGRRK